MRPTQLLIGNVLYWTIRTRDPDTQVLKDADSTPTVAIRKNDASTADSVTVTKRSATTGIYDCQYDPAGEVEGDSYTVEESATVTGTTTDAATYTNSWAVVVKAAERGTDGANTVVPPTVAAFEARTLPSAEYFAVGDYTAPPTVAAISTKIAEDWDSAANGWGDALNVLVDVYVLPIVGGATFDTSTDSLEAIRNRGDAAWVVGANAPAGWINAAAIAASAMDGKGNWNVGKTGYALTQAFPANFASFGIKENGHVSRVNLVDVTTTNTDMRGTDAAATEAKQDAMAGATFDTSTDSLEAIRDRGDAAWVGGGAGLAGPWTRTVTVTDSVSGDPIQNATVRFFRTGETESKATDASGVASFTVEAATWSYAIVASGYAGASGTVVVSAGGDTAVTLVANVVSVADAPLCAVTLPIKDSYGQPIEGAAVFIKFLGFDDAAPPLGLVLSPPPPLTSDASGLVSVDLIRLANYSVAYSTTEDVRRIDISVPDAGAYTVAE